MTSRETRACLTDKELKEQYPENLKLHQVQILLRHGERTPISPRFLNAGVSPYWPYCNAARRLKDVVMTAEDASEWDELSFQRRMEKFGPNDIQASASAINGDAEGICQLGELTDKGRMTTLALGKQFRHLYISQLGFMPEQISSNGIMYLRSTPIPRALESLQQAFTGMYPKNKRARNYAPPTIITRLHADETLFPNEANCLRLAQLKSAFGERTAIRWNESKEMDYLNTLLSRWMPSSSPRVAVNSKPRLTGIADTINSSKAHGPLTKLPKEFYDAKAADIIDRIVVEEWFGGYQESAEYRQLASGPLAGEIVTRMTDSLRRNGFGSSPGGVQEFDSPSREDSEESKLRFGLSGCHDSTIAALLSSLGAFKGEKWPPYTSYVAFELFQYKAKESVSTAGTKSLSKNHERTGQSFQPFKFFSRLFGQSRDVPGRIGRTPLSELKPEQRSQLDGFFVRVRYNDRLMKLPGCAAAGSHLPGDESLCTLARFKEIVDSFTPRNWKAACLSNLDQPPIPSAPQPPGFA